MIPTLRLYCELIPADALLLEPWRAFFQGLRAELALHGWRGRLELVLKVDLPRPGEPPPASLLALLEQRARLDVDQLWLWGQLQGGQVYMNTLTWRPVLEAWGHLVRELQARALPLEGLFFDLEPELDVIRDLSHSHPRALWRLWRRYAGRHHEGATRGVAQGLEALSARAGAPLLAACFPTAALGPLAWSADRWLGTPTFYHRGGSPWPELTTMAYTSFLLPPLEALGVGVEARHRLAAQVAGWLSRAHVARARRAGVRGSVIWGLVAVGILGDEPVFESPELARAALLAVASAGPEALGVFNVWGIAGGAQAPPPGAVPVEARWRAWARVLAQALAAG